MPKSLTTPQTGTIVWYFAASPPTTPPNAALVVKSIAGGSQGVGGPPPTFNLVWFDPVSGVGTVALAVPFYYAARPASGAGAWCTMPRVNENLAGFWPGSTGVTLADMPQALAGNPGHNPGGNPGHGKEEEPAEEDVEAALREGAAHRSTTRTRTTTVHRTSHR